MHNNCNNFNSIHVPRNKKFQQTEDTLIRHTRGAYAPHSVGPGGANVGETKHPIGEVLVGEQVRQAIGAVVLFAIHLSREKR